MPILGTGLSGCIAANIFTDAKLIEKRQRDEITSHDAVLRFRIVSTCAITGDTQEPNCNNTHVK